MESRVTELDSSSRSMLMVKLGEILIQMESIEMGSYPHSSKLFSLLQTEYKDAKHLETQSSQTAFKNFRRHLILCCVLFQWLCFPMPAHSRSQVHNAYCSMSPSYCFSTDEYWRAYSESGFTEKAMLKQLNLIDLELSCWQCLRSW